MKDKLQQHKWQMASCPVSMQVLKIHLETDHQEADSIIMITFFWCCAHYSLIHNIECDKFTFDKDSINPQPT